jgi:predicted metal-dependent hydrolase
VITGADAARLADELLRAGRPFHAHEVLEASWKSGPPAERDLWQGLAQAAVGLTHARRGNARGAVALLRRGAQRARDYAGTERPYGIDVGSFAAACDELAARIEANGLSAIPAGDLSPRLLQP